MRSKILKFELASMVFISVLGSILHFTFNWLNRFWLVGAFSAVNESTWEHLKLAFIPAILWAILESKVFKLGAGTAGDNAPNGVNNFLCAKAAGIWLMPILIVLFFYSYTAILGHNLLVFDISIFVLAVIIGQIVSYKIMAWPEFSRKFDTVCLLSLEILLLAFVIFTFWPPHFFLFNDPVSGLYGIVK